MLIYFDPYDLKIKKKILRKNINAQVSIKNKMMSDPACTVFSNQIELILKIFGF